MMEEILFQGIYQLRVGLLICLAIFFLKMELPSHSPSLSQLNSTLFRIYFKMQEYKKVKIIMISLFFKKLKCKHTVLELGKSSDTGNKLICFFADYLLATS